MYELMQIQAIQIKVKILTWGAEEECMMVSRRVYKWLKKTTSQVKLWDPSDTEAVLLTHNKKAHTVCV